MLTTLENALCFTPAIDLVDVQFKQVKRLGGVVLSEPGVIPTKGSLAK